MRRFCLTQWLALVVLLLTCPLARAGVLLSEGFEDVTTLAGSGWYQVNNSDPLGLTDWFQGDDTVFPAQAGTPTSYIAANYDNTTGATGTISNWLISPELDFAQVDQITFWTRTVDAPVFPDHLEVRMSANGASTSVGSGATDIGDFTTVLVDINPTLTVVDYPVIWTQYTITSAQLPPSGTGRFAFRYFVTSAGPDGVNSDYIGIDSVDVLSKVYTLTYTAGANGSITGTTPQSVDSGGSGTSVTAVPDPGYHFVNWSDGSTANPRTDTNVLADITVTANFALDNTVLSSSTEGFEDITALPASDWHVINNSDPLGLTDWFQGDETVFPAQDGTPTSYIAANFDNTTGGTGTISDWLITPEVDFATTDHISFWTRTVDAPEFPDHLEVRLSTSGASTNVGTAATDVGDFTTLLVDVNPGLTVGGYPNSWTQYTITSASLPTSGTGRLAFRYFVTNAGPTGLNSDYIGIDTYEVVSAIKQYTLSYSAGPNGSISGTTPQTVSGGGSGTPVTAVPAANYHFVNWSDGATDNPRTDTNVNKDIFVTANFAIDTFTLAYTAGANGSIGGKSPQTVAHGGSGTAVMAVPAAHYHFVDWSDGSTANPRTDTNVTANVAVTANFAIDTFTLTYTAGANGSISGTTPQTVEYGGSGTPVTAVPDADYAFVNWSDNSTANPRTDTNVTANITVTANFVLAVPLTVQLKGSGKGKVTSDVPGIDCRYDCQEGYAPGTVVQLTAAPAAGSTFKGWSGDCAGTDRTCTVTMDQARNVTAEFYAFPWPLFVPILSGSVQPLP